MAPGIGDLAASIAQDVGVSKKCLGPTCLQGAGSLPSDTEDIGRHRLRSAQQVLATVYGDWLDHLDGSQETTPNLPAASFGEEQSTDGCLDLYADIQTSCGQRLRMIFCHLSDRILRRFFGGSP